MKHFKHLLFLSLLCSLVLFTNYGEDSDDGFIFRGIYDFILIKGTHQKRAHGKLKVSDKAKDYYRVGVLKSGMHTAVLKEINSTCQCFSKEVILEEFEAYFDVLEREVFHKVFR